MKYISQNGNAISIYLIAVIAATGGVLFGFDTGVISGAIPFLQKDFGIDNSIIEIITTAGLVGAIVGALFCGKVTDVLGRKKVILASAVFFTFGAFWSGIASNPLNLILARFLLGIAIGISSFAVPLYIAEISPAKNRGTLVSMFQLMVTLGVLVSYLSDLFFADEMDSSCWRRMFYVGIIPAIVLLLGILYVPESPRWLISRGLKEKAYAILIKLEGENTANQVMRKMQTDVEEYKKKIPKWKDLLNPKFRKPIFIAIGIMFFQQFIGINTVIYYSPKIFFMAGFDSSISAIWASVGVGVVNLLSTLVSVSLVDKLGRRKLYCIGLSGIAFSLLVLSVSFALVNYMGVVGQWVAVLFVFLYVAFFALSIGPLGWLIISEVFPQEVRSLGTSLGSLSVWIFNSIVTFTFFKIINLLTFSGTEIIIEGENCGNPAGAFGVYGLIALVGLIWGYIYLPETKGVTLESMESLLE